MNNRAWTLLFTCLTRRRCMPRGAFRFPFALCLGALLAMGAAGCSDDPSDGGGDVADDMADDGASGVDSLDGSSDGDVASSDAVDADADTAQPDGSHSDGTADTADIDDSGANDSVDSTETEDSTIDDSTTQETVDDAIDDATPDADAPSCTYVCALDCECQTDEFGCDLPRCVDDPACEDLVAAVATAQQAAASGCDNSGECTSFEYPYCGSIGCYQTAIRQSADIAPLEQAGQAATEAGCAGFGCGCEWPSGAVACIGQVCRQCPPDCGADCSELQEAIGAAAEAAAAGCVTDSDCSVTEVPVCAIGNAIACHAFAHKGDPTATLTLLEASTESLGCGYDACDCQYTVAACVNGHCTPVESDPSVSCFGPEPVFPTFQKDCETADDCALVFHQHNCCGSKQAIGISASEAAAFNLAEATCLSQYPDCDCPAEPTTAEAGGSSSSPSDFAVKCISNMCTSVIAPP